MSALGRLFFVSRAYRAVAKFVMGVMGTPRWILSKGCGAWQRLRGVPGLTLRMQFLLGLAVAAVSIFWGMATAILGLNALYLAAGIIFSIFILVDYRVGVVLLILLLPISNSTIFPHQLLGITGLNPLNLLLIATLMSYALRRFFGGVRHRFMPREVWWLYVVPIGLAAAVGAMHVGEIPSFVALELDLKFDNAQAYLRDVFIRPMYSVFFALLVAAAVVDTRRVEGLLVAGLAALWVIIATVVIFFLASGASLGDISGAGGDSRTFFSPLGFHANGVGRMLAVAFGILLFSASSYQALLPRVVAWASVGIALLATLITFSRGSYLVVLIAGLLYLRSLKNNHRILIMALALPAVLLAMPGAVYNRISFGVGDGADLNTVSSGRTEEIWEPLFPEIFSSPIVGHGLSSIVWSDAMKAGTILVVGHPHNAFLKSLLDMGFLGTALVLLFGWRVWRRMKHLSGDQLLDSRLRGFFAGASAALVGFAISGVSGSSFDPIADQVFLWLAIGVMYGIGTRLESMKASHG